MAGSVALNGRSGQAYTEIWWRKLRDRDYLEDLGVKWEDDIKMVERHGLD
jgi:hypothetical protein